MLALVGVIAFVVWRPSGGSAADTPYRLATVDRGPITASVRATGTVNPVTTVLVGSQLSGQVIEILADYNSPVKTGQVVARLYSEQIKTRRDAARADLQQARADLGQRQAQLERARATVQRAQATLRDQQAQRDRAAAQLAEARRNLERQSELTARSVGSQTTLDAARTQAEVQTATLASSEAQIASQQAEITGLQADVAVAEAQVKSAEAAIQQREAKLKDIEIDLERTEIRSPVDGVVVKRDVELGQTVAASLSAPTLFTIAQDLHAIDIYANIDEADVGRLKTGQPVSFTVNAYPNRTFEGTVRMVRLGAQTIQNVVTYIAVIGVRNQDLALLPGMTANLQILTDERSQALRVPNAALRFHPAGSPATAQAPSAPPPVANVGAPRGGRALEALRERLVAEVQPTAEQLAAIDRILAEARENRPGRQPGTADVDRRTAVRQYRQEVREKISAALDPERRARFAALAQDGQGPRRARAQGDSGTPGRIYVLGEDGEPHPVPVRLGITDGNVTEVLAGDLKDGTAVVVGGGPRPQPASNRNGPPAHRFRGPRIF